MIAIIGAGISGLTSALTLHKLGHKILIIDKGRSVGGRLATRYHESRDVRRYIDTASHYIELSNDTPQLNNLLSELITARAKDNKLIGRGGINSIAKQLAAQLHGVRILTSHKVHALEYDRHSNLFAVRTTHGNQQTTFEVSGVVLTAPVPQSLDLLDQFSHLTQVLRQAPPYHRCLLLLLWPKHQIKPEIFKQSAAVDRLVLQTHIEDNREPIPIAVHATYEWSNAHYDCKDSEIMNLLVAELGLDPADYDKLQVKRWGQAQPKEPNHSCCKGYEFDSEAPLVVCSDALGAGDIHHAGEAGIHAARGLSQRLYVAKPAI